MPRLPRSSRATRLALAAGFGLGTVLVGALGGHRGELAAFTVVGVAGVAVAVVELVRIWWPRR